MATPQQMEKRRNKQTAETLAAVQLLVTEVAELKAAKPAAIDRTGEILAAIGNAFGEIREQVDRNLSACAMIAAEVTDLKQQVIELKALIEPTKAPPQMPTRGRKPKK